MPGPILEESPDLTLRTLEREDAAFLQRLYVDQWTRKGLHASSYKSEAQTEEEIEEEVEDDDTAAFLACIDEPDAPYGHPDEEDTTPVAVVIATHVDRDRPSIVHWVAPEHRGEGHGEAALELAIETLIRTYDAHSIGAAVLDGDDAARERIEALGFVHEGTGRERQFVEGEYRDLHQYGLLREEWEAR
jgi:RimJ/RimL family protein N-acetyltransferase